MIERHLSCLSPSGFHRMIYSEWPGPAGARTVLCAHGLTRNGKDFDDLAEALSKHFRVVCPDMPGRARSEWLRNPAEYGYPVYLADCVALIARLDVEDVDWVGTSMGGLIGMMIAAQSGNPIRRFVINDVGAVVSKEGLARIGSYVGSDPTFDTVDAFVAAVRKNAAPFALETDAQWRKLALDSLREKPGGGFGFNYDPHIGDAFKGAPPEDVNLWPVWDAVRAPTLLLRGSESDLLSGEVAHEMTKRGPKAELVEFAGVGHAPGLVSESQIQAVADFLLKP